MAISQINSNSLASGVPAAANMPAGSVIQTVATSYSFGATTIASTSYLTTNIYATITPKLATSKILVLVNTITYTAAPLIYVTLKRGSTNLEPVSNQGLMQLSAQNVWIPTSFAILDSPATTSSTTYTLFARGYSASNVYVGGDNNLNTITLLEIAQ